MTNLPWDEMVAVGIRTTSDGPFAEDVFWMFLIVEGTYNTRGFSVPPSGRGGTAAAPEGPGVWGRSPQRHGVRELPGTLVGGALLETMQRRLPQMDSRKVALAMGSTSERVFRVWHVEESAWPRDDAALGARFDALVRRLGGRPAAEPRARLLAAWREPHRRYHDVEHLSECLGELDRTPTPPRVADVAELALWYHDAVYAPRAGDNEARSADLLRADATTFGLDRHVVDEAAHAVLATAEHEHAEGAAADLVLDIDVSILGRDPIRFLEYEHAVREEYAHVGSWRFFPARRRILRSFLAREPLYRTPALRARFELPARASLAGLLESPRYRRRFMGLER